MALSRTSAVFSLALLAVTPVAMVLLVRWWQSKRSGSGTDKKGPSEDVHQPGNEVQGIKSDWEGSSYAAAWEGVASTDDGLDDQIEVEIEETISCETTSLNLGAKRPMKKKQQGYDRPSNQDSHIARKESTGVIASAKRLGLTFPFLIDDETRSYVDKSESKVMFIMRGLSGSGKSTIVDVIRGTFKDVFVCSADHFFLQSDGRYEFDANKLTLAHGQSQQNCKEACENGTSVVVIDNTNVKRWEMKSYFATAKANGYVVILVEPKTPWRLNVAELVRRNKHGVSEDILKRKVQEFSDVIPFYYGWFLNEACSRQLQTIADLHVKECLKLFPEFRRELLQQASRHGSTEEAEDEMLDGYFCTVRTSPLLHCTSHFCGSGKVPDATSYHRQSNVQDSYGKVHSLVISGLTITKQTLGARVSLDSECLSLYKRPEEENWKGLDKEVVSKETKGKKKEKKNSKNKGDLKLKKSSMVTTHNRFDILGDDEDEEAADLNVSNMINESSFASSAKDCTKSLDKLFPHLHNSGKARSAHITLKTAPNVESKQTNFDVLTVCDIEARDDNSTQLYPVSRGFASYHGDGICCVYFKEPVLIDALFSGYY